MARRARRSYPSPGQRDTPPIARSAAGSRASSYWPDLPRSRPPAIAPAASVPQRGNRHRPVTKVRRTLPAPSGAVSFGVWSLPSSLLRSEASRALLCARRGIRREVLFAHKSTGMGARSRKRHYSNKGCK